MRARIVLAIVGLFGLSTARAADAPASDAGRLAARAEAILANSCVRCHGAEQKKAGLDLSRRDSAFEGGHSGPAIELGEPDLGLLMEKVLAGEMPPKSPLKPEQVDALRDWIKAGAEYAREPITPPRAGADWWSLRPIQDAPPPAVDAEAGRWVRTPVDAFILAKLRENKLTPAAEADRSALIRRLSFDLVGLPPSPEEVAAFASDPDPLAYETLVDRLLASPRYGERWARHWLDVVRFGESEGYETNMPRFNAWPYRDYVIRAFNRDAPFDPSNYAGNNYNPTWAQSGMVGRFYTLGLKYTM